VLPAVFVAVTFNVCDPSVYDHGKKSKPLLPFMANGALVSILVYVTGEPSSNLTDAAVDHGFNSNLIAHNGNVDSVSVDELINRKSCVGECEMWLRRFARKKTLKE
jgi:hypothetical protein